jgi:hypothetical protein
MLMAGLDQVSPAIRAMPARSRWRLNFFVEAILGAVETPAIETA